jgi:hypothetical protein
MFDALLAEISVEGEEISKVSKGATRPQFRITLKDGRTFLQSHSAGVTPEGLKTFNEKEWCVLVESVEAVPWDSDKRECGDFETVATGKWLA